MPDQTGIPTLADTPGWGYTRAQTVNCPCCGAQTGADMVYDLEGLAPGIKNAIRQELPDFERFLCTGRAATLHRKRLVNHLEVPGPLDG